MLFQEYSLLLVSASRPFNELVLSLLSVRGLAASPPTIVRSISAARRTLAERPYDIILINAPLPDGFGTRLAMDVCVNSEAGVMLFAACEFYEEICTKTRPSGVMTAEKPIDAQSLERNFHNLCAVRERLRRMEEKRVSVEEKIEEIRLVNRAKWRLIERLEMKEADAHRYIEKQAMDQRISRRKVAESILQMYK